LRLNYLCVATQVSLLLAALHLSSCGTGATCLPAANGANSAQPAAAGTIQAGSGGVQAGGYEVIRYNQAGRADPALNGTLHLGLDQQDGRTALLIDVADTAFATTVALDVRYNATRVHPAEVQYAALLGSGEQVLSAAFLDTPGRASLGQTAIGDYRPPALHGRFATLYFAPGPAVRTASAIGGVHQNPDGVDCEIEGLPNFDVWTDIFAQSVKLTWFGGWDYGDGDQNGEVNIADMSPIGLYFAQNTASNWAAVRADYNHNTEVNISDLTPIGQYYGERTTSYTIEGSDDVEGAARTFIASLDWDDCEPYNSTGAVTGQLYPAFNRWQYTISASSAFTYSQLFFLDSNTDIGVYLHVTPCLDDGAGKTATKEVVFAYSDGPDALTIDAFNIKAAEATGGAGETGDLFGSAATQMSVLANQQLTLALDSFSGTYSTAWDAFDFDSADLSNLPLSAPQADELLYACREMILGKLTWDAQQAGAVDFRWTGGWLTDGGGASSGTGDPGLCTVFPDDDPQSDSSLPEGLLVLNLPEFEESLPATGSGFGVHMDVAAEISYAITADVTADLRVPLMQPYWQMTELELLTKLYLGADTYARIPFELTGDAPPMDDPATCLLELRSVDASGNASGPPISFTFNGVSLLEPGQFAVPQVPPPGAPGDTAHVWAFICLIPGQQLQPGLRYAFRLNCGAGWSSINSPEGLLDAVAPAS